LARVDGRVMLVPYVLPGERVRVETVSETKGLVRARPLEVLEPAAGRAEARCSYYGACGGCHYQHMSYERQVGAKKAVLAEVLERVGKMEPPEIVTITAEPFEYRNRVQFHIEGRRLGFHKARTRILQPVMRCPIAHPLINEALAALRRMAHQPRFPGFIQALELFTNGEQLQINVVETDGRGVARPFFEWCAKQMPVAETSWLEYPLGTDTFRVGHRSFFQTNRFLAGRLAEEATAGGGGGRAWDLYAGVGLFTLPLARKFERVTAVESGKGAADNLEHNAARAGVEVEAVRDTVERYLASAGTAPDFVLADPPRAGLGQDVVAHLTRLRPPRLVIVSCDPATLARDLRPLRDAGYRIASMKIVDLFPQTMHIETLTELRL